MMTFWTATTFFIYFLFRSVLFRYVRVSAYVFCHAGVLVCLFVVNVADFGMLSLKIGYRILNCIINFWSFILGFYLSLGDPSSSFQSHFLLQLLFHMFIPIWNSFVSVVIFIGLRFWE